jgi:hypothetical protein
LRWGIFGTTESRACQHREESTSEERSKMHQ